MATGGWMPSTSDMFGSDTMTNPGGSGGGGFGMGGMIASLLGGLGLGSLFGDDGPDYASEIGQIPDAVKPYLQPYSQAGQAQLNPLSQQFGALASDPAGMLNKIGQGYKQSPGLNFAIQQAMMGNNRAAAAGGMAGSPMSQQLSQEKATGLAQQDYQNWLKQATGMYGAGLSGMQGLANMGLTAGTSLSDTIAQAIASQAQAEQAQNASQNAGIGGMIGGLASLASVIPW